MMRRYLSVLAGVTCLLCTTAVGAVERVSVCFNYGCLSQAEVVFDEIQLGELRQLLFRAATPDDERRALGEAVGRLLGWAGQQSPIAADRGGNYADDAVYGRMDCIDHSTTTTRLLHLLEGRGWLRFHRVLDPVLRSRFMLFEHYSAQIEEIVPAGESAKQQRFVVDSWFFDNGHPAAVMPLMAWMSGESPNVDN